MSAQINYKQLLKITMILFIIQIWWRWWHYRTCNCSSWCYSRWCHHQMQVLSQRLQRKRSLLRKCRWTTVISLQNHMILSTPWHRKLTIGWAYKVQFVVFKETIRRTYLNAHVHAKYIAKCIEFLHRQKIQKSPNQNAGTISKQQHKHAMSLGWLIWLSRSIPNHAHTKNSTVCLHEKWEMRARTNEEVGRAEELPLLFSHPPPPPSHLFSLSIFHMPDKASETKWHHCTVLHLVLTF